MIASLTTAFCSLMRYDLTSRRGLPFGAAFAALQIQQFTYLVSPDLWGSMSSKAYSSWFKLRLFLSIVLFGLLVAVVGPAGAASMVHFVIMNHFSESVHLVLTSAITDP